MPREEEDYRANARVDAIDMVQHFEDEIVEQLVDRGEASDDYNNDYPDGDSYHHESHVDRAYNLLDAAKLLDQLGKFEETDSGLWEGQMPRDAIATQAAFTYGNAVSAFWSELVKAINEKAGEITYPRPAPAVRPTGGSKQDWRPKARPLPVPEGEEITPEIAKRLIAEAIEAF